VYQIYTIKRVIQAYVFQSLFPPADQDFKIPCEPLGIINEPFLFRNVVINNKIGKVSAKFSKAFFTPYRMGVISSSLHGHQWVATQIVYIATDRLQHSLSAMMPLWKIMGNGIIAENHPPTSQL
jgi:hypothetical protein